MRFIFCVLVSFCNRAGERLHVRGLKKRNTSNKPTSNTKEFTQMTYDEFTELAQGFLKKDSEGQPLTHGEKLIVAQYTYEDYVPMDGILLTYYNFNAEMLDLLIEAYTKLDDKENLELIQSFAKWAEKINRDEDYSAVMAKLSDEDLEFLDNISDNYPLGEEESYSNILLEE